MLEEEINTIHKSVYMYNEEILYVKDDAYGLEESVYMLERMVALFTENNAPYILIDLTNGKRPTPEKKELIKTHLKKLSDSCKLISFYTGKNILINVAIQFVLGGVGIPISVSKSKKEALKKLENFQ